MDRLKCMNCIKEESACVIRHKINELSKKGMPFLFVLDYEMSSGYLIEEPLDCTEVLFKIGEINNFNNYLNKISPSSLMQPNRHDSKIDIIDKIDYNSYKQKFEIVMNGLKRGDSYLSNLTCKTRISVNVPFETILLNSDSYFGIYIPNKFISFSPERFVKIENSKIYSYPMKGTIKLSEKDAYKKIMEDHKEGCEHATIVDLIRNDIGIVSDCVSVERYRYADIVNTSKGDLIQISSEVVGQLSTSYRDRLGDLLFSLLPAGSISGAPKSSTVKILREAEGESRGYYTGIFGYFDGKSLDSAVLIRFIEIDPGGSLWYRSGGGVTINSDCQMEYSEMLDKIYLPYKRNML